MQNVKGMIRRRHPKGTDFSKVTAEEIAATENWINSYPRKIFGYKSAGTMFRECWWELVFDSIKHIESRKSLVKMNNKG